MRAGEGQFTTGMRHVAEVDEQQPEMEPHRLCMGKTACKRAEA